MGVVYFVSEREDGPLGAIKTYQARYVWSDDIRDQFFREAEAWVMLDPHPNVVTAIRVDLIEGFPCVLTEYVAGGDLAERIEAAPLPLTDALGLALQVCDGMEHIHRRGRIIHRDLKPSNCLLGVDGTLKVTDLGLAKPVLTSQESWDVSPRPAMHGLNSARAGTRSYMAPEQFTVGAALDGRADIHAFGVMLYQLVAGDLPPSGDLAREYIARAAVGRAIESRLLSLILHCVETSPNNRPSSFTEVRTRLVTIFDLVCGRPAPSSRVPAKESETDWWERGISFGALGRNDLAIACYDRALDANPNSPEVWANKGSTLHRMGRFDEALVCFERGLTHCTSTSTRILLWGNKGAALEELGLPLEALNWFDRVVNAGGATYQVWRNMGVTLFELGRHSEALACFECALRDNMRDADSWWRKAATLMALDRCEDALDDCAAGLEIMPRSADLWRTRGLVLERLDQQGEALESYERALTLAPEDIGLWRHRAGALVMAGLYRAGLACCEGGLVIAPYDYGLRVIKGWALAGLDRRREAIVLWQSCLEENPNSALLERAITEQTALELGATTESLVAGQDTSSLSRQSQSGASSTTHLSYDFQIETSLGEAVSLLLYRRASSEKLNAEIRTWDTLISQDPTAGLRVVLLRSVNPGDEFPWILAIGGSLKAQHGKARAFREAFQRLFGDESYDRIWPDNHIYNWSGPGEAITAAGRQKYEALAHAIRSGQYEVERVIRS
jgi:serine/threonine protein kinase